MHSKLSITFCRCGNLSANSAWKVSTSTLASFQAHVHSKGITRVVFVKVTCPDFFEGKKLGVYHATKP